MASGFGCWARRGPEEHGCIDIVGMGVRGSTAEMAPGVRGLGFVLIRRSTHTGH